MRNRRFAAVLVPLLAIALTAGCAGEAGSSGTAAKDKPADPKAALAASTQQLKAGNYTFKATIPGGTVADGVVHLPSRSAALNTTATVDGSEAKIQMLVVEPDRYTKMKIDLGDNKDLKDIQEYAQSDDPTMRKLAEQFSALFDMFSGKYWMRVDTSKVTSKELQLGLDNPDLTGAGAILSHATTAQQNGSVITGTVDASQADSASQLLSSSLFEGADVTALPYEATLDDQGRLSKLVLDVPKTKDTVAGEYTLTVADYGSATAQAAPPKSETKEATDQMYDMMNKYSK
ncbi:hypothetical protein [Actinoplanes sp. N902-109]|uniref:hypothetical protein n=1 Tax=Actinoplanes sp. (strain N902-109) TaxID=649831 RepID=UPI0003293BA1|nr:hypothetical protein [Actinoplanes sp. N902-109]AGL15992.1 hypothetical protein L083_2482 [Actinoplanes sp. N902-109]